MILGAQKQGPPTRWDLLLAHAETILDLERCGSCGQPKYICQNDDPDIDFRVFEETCNAMRKKAQHEKRKEKDTGRDGVMVGTEAFTHSNTPLEQFRSSHYEKEAAKRAEREGNRRILPREHPPGWTPKDE